jgi:hypothetical protein
MEVERLLLDLAKIVSPWLGIGGGIGSAIWKLSPYIKQVIGLYAKYTIASEKQAEALKEIALGVKTAVNDIHLVKTQLPKVCGYNGNERRAVGSSGQQ